MIEYCQFASAREVLVNNRYAVEDDRGRVSNVCWTFEVDGLERGSWVERVWCVFLGGD